MGIIHIVLGKANPDRMNGVNKVVYELATKQAAFGENVSVWGISKDKDHNYGERNFETRLFYKQANPFAFSNELKMAIVEKKNKAIFHFHGGWIPVFYSLSKWLNKHNIPFVFTPHGAYNTVAMKRSSTVKKIYFKLFEKIILKHCSKIHCIGKSEITGLEQIFRNEKSILLPYGFENAVKPIIVPSINNHIVFGFVGRLDIYTKGLDTLLEAFEKFLLQQPQAQLWIVGDSKEKSSLEKQINEKLLEKNVIFYGSKFGSEKETLIQNMDVFVHPSRNEGLPLSVIEAASFGKPCIVTDATNIGDLIVKYKAGATIYSQNCGQLETAMNAMFDQWKNEDAFLQMRLNAVKMIEENYNWGTIIIQFNQDLYSI